MKERFCIVFLTLLMSATNAVLAQNSSSPNNSSQNALNSEPTRFEIGGQATAFESAGIGGRFTYNVNKSVALEAESNFFRPLYRGFTTQALFGIKAGKRFNKFGFFGKARPGFVYRNRGDYVYISRSGGAITTADPFPYQIRFKSRTDFAADLGGVIEYYPTKRLILRVDVGDTIVYTSGQTVNVPDFSQPNTFPLRSITIPDYTTHKLQISAGVGFRF